ncbi:MAG: DNA polymerase III subunit gamma/tau [Hyphomicrobiaceae bacterium]|nr:DNA polymerase III subunit gamma/tau [Hyphomicrobiaceae bacterium]
MAEKANSPYLVLARKYRPRDFSAMIGQQAMVQTLTNAFKSGRIHHAFILTGVRGVGKTTTARILARAFNYVGKGGAAPTLDLSTPGEHCEAIIEGRHVDVLEMDAASNTGINDIREIIDSVRYGPVSAPYKVYIIDEVHMLSNQAFNGLLKTLEEPPPYVKFIFATTEIRKVPVTILSRCQRFDLRRVPADQMIAYLGQLLANESLEAEPEAISLIVRAGEGSVRDCLSLLDQAISYAGGKVTAETVTRMLGLADRTRILDLFEELMAGRIADALDNLRNQYDLGADPETMIADLANLTHVLTRMKLVPAAADDPALTPEERTRGAEMAQKLNMRALTRTWQILQSGLEEVTRAPNAIQAAEMVLVRLAHAADLPTPDELILKINSGETDGANQPQGIPSQPHSAPRALQSRPGPSLAVSQPRPDFVPAEPAPEPAKPRGNLADPRSFAELVVLASAKRDLIVKDALEASVRLVSFEPGRMEIGLIDGADRGIVQTLIARLRDWTGRNWIISVTNDEVSVPTLREQSQADRKAAEERAGQDPLVRAVLDAFPKSKIVNVRQIGQVPATGAQSDADEEEED